MSIYFGFSDECGCYQTSKTRKYLKVHPHYIRSTLLIRADEWKHLRASFADLKRKYKLPLEREIKWAYLWQLRYYQINGKAIPEKKDFKFLESYDHSELIKFVESSLALLDEIEFKKIIISHTDNTKCTKYGEKSILKMHLQEHMQRLEMEIQTKTEENLAVLFFDPVSEKTDKLLRNIYFDLFNSGDFISIYRHIKDSLNIEESHQSVGIQIADYISGTFSSILKGRNNSAFGSGKKMFYSFVYPNLRRYQGVVWGAGIREVPHDMTYRRDLAEGVEVELQTYK